MSIYTKILVVADINHDEQIALARAMQLAEKSSRISHVTLFLSIYDFSYDMTSMLSTDEREAMRNGVIKQREQWLKKLSEPYLMENVELEVKVVWHHRAYEAILSELFAGGHDLLVKATRKHATLQSVIFTPTDWHLLRKCPTPVLLVKHSKGPDNANVVASIHVGSESDVHFNLNDKIVQRVVSVSQRFSATPYLVTAYPRTPMTISLELPEFDPSAYGNAVKKHYNDAMEEVRQKHDVAKENVIVEEGLPEEVIPDIVSRLNVAMVILGTTGRSGLSAAFIGNTAEHVIDKIDCDVLALKPEGYISPLDPESNT